MLEYSMRREQAQHTVQRSGVNADRRGQFFGRLRSFVERAGYPKIRYCMQASSHDIPETKVMQREDSVWSELVGVKNCKEAKNCVDF